MAGKSALCRGGYARISAYSKPSNERSEMAPIGCDHIIHGYESRRYDMFLSFAHCGVGWSDACMEHAMELCRPTYPIFKAFVRLLREKV